ncbi:hypothetical protein BU25DRAFT_95938 [Macroventuria anomochaeta]|uniref:Uncharacterized protein n=1 Tax=Macroventuria anomochaeta TaxID=301207 RepID=A0ACB6RX17_9PLEO|nr:uncharacterized protein BU25DRAFT_95938 [Macroventuria anomochaeta]KAF2626328.1 hypothetical protein BU25DRAFT_95938 [Macroventuria anomochaeta]
MLMKLHTDRPRVPLAFASMTPKEVCKAFSQGLGRPVRYKRGPVVINVPTPIGYREHLSALEYTLGEKGAPYFGPDIEPDCPSAALELWEGNRSMEEYAREVFPVEEAANGLTWMEEGELQAQYQYPNSNGTYGINGISGLADQLNQARL